MSGFPQSRTQSFDQRVVASRDSRELGFYLNVLIGCPVTDRNVFPLFYRRKPAVIKFQYPRVSTGGHSLTKNPEDSGYEIGFHGSCNGFVGYIISLYECHF